MTGTLVIVGDALLDRDIEGTAGRLCPDAPVPVVDEQVVRERPGGAALAAYLAARTYPGRQVVASTKNRAMRSPKRTRSSSTPAHTGQSVVGRAYTPGPGSLPRVPQ